MIKEVTRHSPLFEDVQVFKTYTAFNFSPGTPESLDIGSEFPTENFAPLTTVKFDWGEIDILVSKDEDPNIKYSNGHFLSNGLWQFDETITDNPLSAIFAM